MQWLLLLAYFLVIGWPRYIIYIRVIRILNVKEKETAGPAVCHLCYSCGPNSAQDQKKDRDKPNNIYLIRPENMIRFFASLCPVSNVHVKASSFTLTRLINWQILCLLVLPIR